MTGTELAVSILIPTRNRRGWLEEAIETARAQGYKPLEILVSDDGSTDGTQDSVRKVAQVDPRVKLLPPNPRQGLFENLNHLISHATGDAFFFLGDDDRLLPESIAKLARALDAVPGCSVVTGEYWLLDADGQRNSQATEHRITRAHRGELAEGPWDGALAAALAAHLNLGAALFRRTALATFAFDTRCGGAADVELWIRIAERGPVGYLPEKVAEIRTHQDQVSARRVDYNALGVVRAMELHPQSNPDLERERLRVLQRYRAGLAARRATTNQRETIGFIVDYLKDAPRSWEPRALASLGISAALSLIPPGVAASLRRRLSAITGQVHPTERE